MCFMYGLYLEIIQIVWMVFRYMIGFYSWNFQFRTLYMELIHIKCGLYRCSLDIMPFVQLFLLTFLLEGAPCVYLLPMTFLGGEAVAISSSSSFAFLFNLSSFHFSSSSIFLSSLSLSCILSSFFPPFLFSLIEHLLSSIPLSSPFLSHLAL